MDCHWAVNKYGVTGDLHLHDHVADLDGRAVSGGSITAHAEFNIYVDPEAADYVMSSGLPLHMVGLDVTQARAVCRRVGANHGVS